MKSLTLFGQFNLQIAVQNSFFLHTFDSSPPAPLPLSLASHLRATWYALFTMKSHFFVQAQIRASFGRLGLIGILKIASASKGKKTFFTAKVSQPPASRSIKCSIGSTSKFWGLGLATMKEFGIGIHLSAHIFVFLPFPIFHLKPLWRTSCAAIKLLHVYDEFFQF